MEVSYSSSAEGFVFNGWRYFWLGVDSYEQFYYLVMAYYIDKDALVAEINRVLNSYDPNEITSGRYALVNLRNFIDTLEVKEGDFEKYYHEFLQKEWFGNPHVRTVSEMMAFTAKHFFELGLRVSQPTTSVYGIEEALKENGIDLDSKEADMYREAIYKIYDRLKAQKGE